MSIINKACIKDSMLRAAVHGKKKKERKKKNMIVLPVEVVSLENLKMHLKFTIDEVTATTIYIKSRLVFLLVS